jgi:hypothetical protein
MLHENNCWQSKGIKLYRVPGFLSIHLNWIPLPPPLQASVAPPHFGPSVREIKTRLRERGGSLFRRLDRNSDTLFYGRKYISLCSPLSSETETAFHYCWRVKSSFVNSNYPYNSLIGCSLKWHCFLLVWSKSLLSKTGFHRPGRDQSSFGLSALIEAPSLPAALVFLVWRV